MIQTDTHKLSSQGELKVTMMKRFCQIQRLEATEGFAKMIDSERHNSKSEGRSVFMDDAFYDRILNHLKTIIPSARHHQSFPHPLDAAILQPDGLIQSTTICKDNLQISVMAPNHCICFKVNDKIWYGMVCDIVTVKILGHASMQLLNVQRIENLFLQGDEKGRLHFSLLAVSDESSHWPIDDKSIQLGPTFSCQESSGLKVS
jgi:hypothetical protein